MKRYISATLMLIVFVMGVVEAQENWPQWRGPQGNGVSQATGLPTTWSAVDNIVWKAPLPSWSGSTPVIWGERIFLTSPSAVDTAAVKEAEQQKPEESQGRRKRHQGRHPGGEELLLLCLAKKDGAVLWSRPLDQGNKTHLKHNNTSPSPVTDGKHVWAITGNGVVTAFDMEGEEIWQRNLQSDYGPFGLQWGYASSPLLFDGKLIIEVLHGSHTDEPSYIVAFDAATGKEIWHQQRPTDAVAESPDAYTTPALLEFGGQTQIVITGGDYVTGHDVATGAEVWRAGGLNPEKGRNYRIAASPLAVDGMIYAPTRKRPLLALRAGGSGDITASHLAWKWEGEAATDVPTPVCDGQYFYMVDDRGKVICLDAKSGTRVWEPQRTAQGNVSASPLLADGKLYLLNENAVTTVLAAGPQYKMLATNELDGSFTLSSPVVSGSQLFIRTSTHLYCIGEVAD